MSQDWLGAIWKTKDCRNAKSSGFWHIHEVKRKGHDMQDETGYRCIVGFGMLVLFLAVVFGGIGQTPTRPKEVEHTGLLGTGAHGIPYCSMTRIDGVCESVQGEGYKVCRTYIDRRGQKRIGHVGSYLYLSEARKAYRGG